MKSSSWQGNDLWGMIRTPAVNCATIPDCSKDYRITVVDTTSDEMGMGAVRALCEFSVLVCQQNHSNLTLPALDNALKQFHNRSVIFENKN